jgi:5-carboxymethyl-2-hydroxymuconate isomerase
MPYVTLEYSENICEKNTIKDLFSEIHLMLVEQLPTKLLSCKSRAIEYQTYFLGDGNTPNAFVHVELRVMKGRTVETLNKVADHFMNMLRKHFTQSGQSFELEVSLEITELSDTYYSP